MVVEGIPGFWEAVATAGELFLVLDYDGTLAPFRVNRMEAVPLEGALEALTTIRDSGRTRVAMVTGRPLSELLELVGDLGVPMVGSHGFEYRGADGTVETSELPRAQTERFEIAEAQARALSPAARVERKPASVALHTRGMPDSEAEPLHERVCAEWSQGAAEAGLECRRFSGGVELRVKGIDKGTAVARLLEGTGEQVLCVYVGDDETDEDAFAALPTGGVGIKVGPREVVTGARGRLADPEAVRRFLLTWAEVTAK